MKFAPIVPTLMLDHIRDYTYHMVLAQRVIEDPDYYHWYRKCPGYLILDNGVAEGASIHPDRLIDIAVDIGASEVIAPDILGMMTETLYNLHTFDALAGDLRERHGIGIMAVLQAQTWLEFDQIFEAARGIGNVTCFGLPKLMTTWMPERIRARTIAALIMHRRTTRAIHCLGSAGHLSEVQALARLGQVVRGIDSSAPVVLGLQGRRVDALQQYDLELSHRAIPDFWSQALTPEVEVNLATFRSWCEETPPSSKV